MRIQQSCVVHLGKIAYWVRDRVEPFSIINPIVRREGLTPAVVLHTSRPTVTVEFLENKFREFAAKDDVFSPRFYQKSVIYIQSSNENEQVSDISFVVDEYVKERALDLQIVNNDGGLLPEGPYFVSVSGLHQAWRLYPDIFEAFTTSVVPDPDEFYGFQPLQASAYQGLHSVVAVPSRLYSPESSQKPLNGVRVAVKDIFNLQGIVTTLGSRAYSEQYGSQQNTSEYIRHLIDLGVVLVGKTKMSAFAGSEIPPEKCIDYFPPWNPRADGYQGPSGSSSGAGASIAGYDWLDISLASDTTGSMRMPAASYGLWGLRLSVNAVSWQGITPSVPLWDTVGIIGRNAGSVKNFVRSSINSVKTTKAPVKLLYPIDWFPRPNHNQQVMNDQFVEAVERSTGISRTDVSLSGLWAECAPIELRSKPLTEYLGMSAYWVNNYDGYHTFDQFRQDYRERFSRDVYVSPWQRARWNRGVNVTLEQRNQGLGEISIFEQWIHKYVIPKDYNDSNTIMFLPLGRPGANYRDELPKPPPTDTVPDPFEDTAYEPIFFSTILGFPQLVIPIGQNPFTSRNSGNQEYVPIVGSIVGPKGSELQLLQIAEDALSNAGWPTNVLTGQLAFQLADNDRNAGPDTLQKMANGSQLQQPLGLDAKYSL